MEALTELLANGTAIKQLPASTGYLKKLTSTRLKYFTWFESVANRIVMARRLQSWRSGLVMKNSPNRCEERGWLTYTYVVR
uniref:Uncharacterized protein n=1 Tax=Salix viminalis TaxID=40686 RepID=A0A6N2L141_SALVM